VPSIEEVLAKIKVPVRSVPICMDADLQAEHDELTNQLDVLNRETNGKMNGRTEAREIADRLRELEKLMHDSEVTFKFRGLTRGAIRKLQEKFPPPDPNPNRWTWNVDAGAATLLSQSAIQPTMTLEDAEQLLATLDEGRAGVLVNAAWTASTGSTQVPFSVRASALIDGTGSN
jgi:hypothetical protein